MASAIEKKSFVVVNLLEDAGMLYSVNEKYSDHKPEATIFRNIGLDFDKKITNKLEDKIKQAASNDSVALDEVTVVPMRKGMLETVGINKVDLMFSKHRLKKSAYGYDRNNIITKLSDIGMRQKVDIVIGILPTKGMFQLKPVSTFSNKVWFATPTGMAYIYFENRISACSSLEVVAVDSKTKSILNSAGTQAINMDIDLPSRILSKEEIKELRNWVNIDSSVDFNKPLSESQIKNIIEREEDESEEDNSLYIKQYIKPLHHSMNNFKSQPPEVIKSMREALYTVLLESVDYADIMQLLSDIYTADE